MLRRRLLAGPSSSTLSDMDSTVVAALKGSRIGASASEQTLDALAALAVRKTYAEGDAIWRAGERAVAFTIVTRGFIKVVRELPQGQERIVALFGPRESAGDVAVLNDVPYPAHAIAASKSVEIIQVRREAIIDWMARDPGLAKSLSSSMLEHTGALVTSVGIHAAGKVDHRVARLLSVLYGRFGDEGENGEGLLPLSLSRIEIAQLAGVTPETAIRCMSRWQKRGVLSTVADGFRIHQRAVLAALADGSDLDETEAH